MSWKTIQELREAFTAEVKQHMAAILPTDPPIYDPLIYGDPFAEMDRELANAALEAGHDVFDVARKLAARSLAREFGRENVRHAVMMELIQSRHSAAGQDTQKLAR